MGVEVAAAAAPPDGTVPALRDSSPAPTGTSPRVVSAGSPAGATSPADELSTNPPETSAPSGTAASSEHATASTATKTNHQPPRQHPAKQPTQETTPIGSPTRRYLRTLEQITA